MSKLSITAKIISLVTFIFNKYYYQVYFHINAIVNNITHTKLYFMLQQYFPKGLSNVKLSLMDWDINNCIKFYLNVNIDSEMLCK